MTPEKRKELEGRRVLLQQKQQATAFVESRVRPFIEILQTLKKNEVDFNIVEFFNISPEWSMFLDEILLGDPFAAFGLNKANRINNSVNPCFTGWLPLSQSVALCARSAFNIS